MLVQFASNSAGPWTTVQTLNSATHVVSAACAASTVTFPAPPGDLFIRFSGTWTSGDYWFYLDDINITQGPPPACASPTNVTTSAVTANSASLQWDASTSGTVNGYQWEVRSSGAAGSGATGLAASGNTSAATTTANVTGLTDNTSYSVYVRTDCGSTFSSWTAAHIFLTACLPATLPYMEDFESATLPNLPNCTSRETIGASNPWKTITLTQYGFNSKVLNYSWDLTNAANAWFYTRPVNLNAGTSYRLRYRFGNNSVSSYSEKMKVMYGTAPDAASMTDLIADHPNIVGAAAQDATYDFVPAVSGLYYIGFHAYSDPDQDQLYLDNIMLMVTPTCEEPTGLAFSNITTNTVQLDWVAPVASSPIDYEIYVSTSNTAPPAATTPTVLGVAGFTTNLTSLSANTTYFVWIRSNCGGGDKSIWSQMATVTTACTSVTAFSENFDGVAAPALPDCWNKLLRGATLPTAANITTSTTANNFTSAPNGIVMTNSSAGASDDIILVSRPVSNLAAGTHRLRFRARNASATNDLEVGTLNDVTASGIFTVFQPVDINTTWAEYVVDFTSYSGTDQYIAIRRLNTVTFSSVFLDDIVWEPIPTCDAPTGLAITNITSDGGDLDWTPPGIGSPVDYQIFVSNTNTAPTSATTPTVSGVQSPYTITGLNPATQYWVWVRSNCGGSDISGWSIATNFTTDCVGEAIPTANQSFDLATLPVCWTTALVTGTNNWAPATSNDGVPSARTGARFMGKTWTNSDALLFSQPINMTTAGANGARINVWIYRNSVNANSDVIRFHVNTVRDLSGASQILEIFANRSVAPVVATNGWYNYTAEIPSSYNMEPVVYVIAQGVTSAGFSAYGIGFDDFRVENTPSCVEPTGVAVANIGTTEAEINWVAPSSGTPVDYQIFFSTTNTAPTGATTPSVSGAQAPHLLTGLTPNTQYWVWVRTNCGGTDQSVWTSATVSFTTLPTCNVPTSLAVSGVTMTDAQVDWTAPSVGTVTDFSWELRTSGAAGSGASGLVSSGTTASSPVNFTTLTAGTPYTFHVRTNCVSTDVSSWVSVSFTTMIANDDCSGAVVLTAGVTVPGTTVGATESMPGQLCAGFTGTADDDVWYQFTAVNNGAATVALTNPSTGFDAVIIVYSGTCGALTQIGCADQTFGGDPETVNLTSLTAGETYYFRVYSYGSTTTSRGSFSITVSGPAVLPVTLISFSGENAGNSNRLTWSTSTESNNKGFELERSADGRNFSSIGFVASKAEGGNSNVTIQYTFSDNKPLGGTNYYRLKQVDRDGRFTYSNVVELRMRVSEIRFSSVYPNPTNRDLNLVISSPLSERVSIVVTDLTGKVLLQQRTQLMTGDNQLRLNVQQLAAGTYIIKAICANGCESAVHRFVKQ